MTMNCEFLAGTTIEEAVSEAKSKAIQLDLCYMCFNFNGVSFSISQSCDEQAVIEEYRDGTPKYGIVG